ILVLQASANGADRVFTAPQQFVISRDGALRVAQARDEGLVVGPGESEHDGSLRPRGGSRQRVLAWLFAGRRLSEPARLRAGGHARRASWPCSRGSGVR